MQWILYVFQIVLALPFNLQSKSGKIIFQPFRTSERLKRSEIYLLSLSIIDREAEKVNSYRWWFLYSDYSLLKRNKEADLWTRMKFVKKKKKKNEHTMNHRRKSSLYNFMMIYILWRRLHNAHHTVARAVSNGLDADHCSNKNNHFLFLIWWSFIYRK